MSKPARLPWKHEPSFREALKIPRGFRLADLDPASTPGFQGGKADGSRALAAGEAELDDLQERLHAQATAGAPEAVLLILQAMDTAGKGGIVRHVAGLVDPQGLQITAFKAPTDEERSHDFLWRIRRALPRPGRIGIFDRSHYEDVLVVRVNDLAPRAVWSKRYAAINAFEREVVGTRITPVKVMLHLSREEQQKRLLERLERPDKQWKYNPGDVDARTRWEAYMEAYQAVFDRTSTREAPWHVVPADRKWYARLAVQRLLIEHLREVAPRWPAPSFDPEVERQRVLES
ncbi:MAG: Polyphosphate kinase 2 (PPK2) [Acidobacteria bacterium ADurb.Bin340]|nr:MAG: Polyphosphate kinase 2 (PPK2) [Acidobacteria bacterium ADurb.Bin340]